MDKALKLICFMMLLCGTSGAQILDAILQPQPSTATCTLPADVVYQYTGWNGSNTCGTTGGSSCTTNGQAFFSFADSVGGNTASQSTTGDQGTLATSFVNGLSAVTFNGTSDFYTPTTTVPSSNVIYTFLAVFQLAATGSTQGLAGTSGQSVVAQISSTNHFQLSMFGVGSLGQGTTTLTTSTNYAFLGTYNKTSGAWQIWRLASGTATSDGSGTTAGTVSGSAWAAIGKSSSSFFHGTLVELDLSESAPTASQYATYTNCKYAF
jgi:hypothetical protein